MVKLVFKSWSAVAFLRSVPVLLLGSVFREEIPKRITANGLGCIEIDPLALGTVGLGRAWQLSH